MTPAGEMLLVASITTSQPLFILFEIARKTRAVSFFFGIFLHIMVNTIFKRGII